MLDVKSRGNYPNNCSYPVITHSHSPVFICPPPHPRQEQYNSQDLYNPVYEELSNGKTSVLCSNPILYYRFKSILEYVIGAYEEVVHSKDKYFEDTKSLKCHQRKIKIFGANIFLNLSTINVSCFPLCFSR